MEIFEVSFRDIHQDEHTRAFIEERAQKLERVCNYIQSCRVTVEQAHSRHKTGNAFRCRIDLTVPAGNELIASNDTSDRDQSENLTVVIRKAFDAAERQLKTLVEKQRRHVKSHPDQQLEAVVIRLFADRGYGFLRDLHGREVYFHRNSVLGNDFDRLEVGTGVNFDEDEVGGEHGPQASSVRIVDKPGVRSPKVGEKAIKPPLGWGA